MRVSLPSSSMSGAVIDVEMSTTTTMSTPFSRSGRTDRATGRAVGSIAFLTELDKEFMIEKAPPQEDLLSGKIGIDVVMRALDHDSGIPADLASFGFARKGAETLPGAHFPDTAFGQSAEPILDPTVRLAPMGLLVVAVDEVTEPGVRLRFGLRPMKVIQGFVGFLDRPKWPLDLAF